MAGPTWRIISMVSEPLCLLQAFVAHWLSHDPTGITLFQDTPDKAVARTLRSADPRVEVVPCDARFWAGFGAGRRWAQSGRQIAILQRACDTAAEDWVLHVDADEMLRSTRPVADILAGATPNVSHVFLQVSERVHTGPPDPADIFDGVFRRPTPPHLAAEVAAIDGDLAPLYDRGLTGYASGKSFFRTRSGLEADIHAPRNPPEGSRMAPAETELLHFDGFTPHHYVTKKRRTMAQQPAWRDFRRANRVSQFKAVLALGDGPAAEEAFYRRIKELTPDRAAALEALGLLSRQGFDPRPDLARWFPGEAIDLSRVAFDSTPITWTARRDRQVVLARLRGMLGLQRR